MGGNGAGKTDIWLCCSPLHSCSRTIRWPELSYMVPATAMQVEAVKTEVELFQLFVDAVRALDPDVLVGYDVQKVREGCPRRAVCRKCGVLFRVVGSLPRKRHNHDDPCLPAVCPFTSGGRSDPCCPSRGEWLCRGCQKGL